VLAFILAAALLLGSIILATRHQLWFAPGPAVCGLLLAFPLWGWRRLSAVSAFLNEKASSLSHSSPQPAPSGFDTVAREVNRLGFLVNALDQRHSLLRKVVESSPQAMCAFASDGSLILQNHQADLLFGPTEVGAQMQDLLVNVRGKLNPERSEMTLADGRAFAMSESLAAADEAGEGLTIIAFADISIIRTAEAERRQMLDFLSHDMRSPQVAIIGLANGVKAESDAIERLSRVVDHARRTLSLADTFVQISRLAEVPLDLAEVDLVALANEAIDRGWHLAKARQITVKLTNAPETAFLNADPVVLSRVFDNLISNAVSYCPGGSAVSLAISAGAAAFWRIGISDNGPGLPPARRSDPFVRFGPRGSGGGSGLGLSFVAAAVRKHGGTIVCQSDEHGTAFEIELAAGPSMPG
jgi:signal transduction histidine kinase